MPILAYSLCHIFYLFYLWPCSTSFVPASATLLRSEQSPPSLSASIPPYSEHSGLQSYSYACLRLTYRKAALHVSRQDVAD